MSNLTNNTAELNKILAAVNALPEAGGGGINPTGTIEITENGTHDVTNYATAEVNVPSKEPVLQEGNATPTKSQQTVEPPSGVDGFSKFVVEKIPDQYIVPAGTAEITENGEHDVTGYAKVDVNVPDIPAVTEELSVTKNGTWEPGTGVDGFSKVVVNVPDTPAVVRPLEVTENGTYTTPNGVDGYSPVTVNVPSENLAAEIEAQAALIEEQAGKIEELLTVLDGKAAGGGGSGEIETCTLRIVGVENQNIPGFPTGAILYLMYPTLDSKGNIEWVDAEIGEPTALVEIENVVINEMLWFEGTDMTAVFNGYISKTENAEMIVFDINSHATYVKCTTPNAVSVITVEADY